MGGRSRTFRAAIAVLAAVALAAGAARLRAVLAAPDEVPVVFYASVGDGPDAVPPDLFYLQMRDLADGGFKSVAPSRLRARVRWGWPLPDNPLLLVVGEVGPEALPEVAGTLDEYEFGALLGTDLAGLEGIGLSGKTGLARIGGGRGADPLSSLPCIRADGAAAPLSVQVVRDSVDPAFFGTLRVAAPSGTRMPLSVLAYEPHGDAPFVQADVPVLEPGGSFGLPLPASLEFPLDVTVYETNRVLLYHSVSILKTGVIRPAGWREPAAPPDQEVEFEGL